MTVVNCVLLGIGLLLGVPLVFVVAAKVIWLWCDFVFLGQYRGRRIWRGLWPGVLK